MRAAISSSLRVTFTPTLMLGANTTPSERAAAAMRSRPTSSKPVVPMTRLVPWARQAATCSSVPSGRVKSIRQSASARAARSSVTRTPVLRPRNAPASWPRPGLPARSSATVRVRSSASSTASMSSRPMRPPAPATATRIGAFMSDNYVGRSAQRHGAAAASAGARHRSGRRGGGRALQLDHGIAHRGLALLVGLRPGLAVLAGGLGRRRRRAQRHARHGGDRAGLGQRTERRLFATGLLEGLQAGLRVALPAGEHVAVEEDGELALLDLAIAGLEEVGVFPAVGMEDRCQRGRAEHVADLLARHARAQLRDLLGGDPVALLHVGAIRLPE